MDGVVVVVVPVPKQAADSSPSDANDHLKYPILSLKTATTYIPVGCDHGGVVANPCDPGGSPGWRVGHRGVGVVVNP